MDQYVCFISKKTIQHLKGINHWCPYMFSYQASLAYQSLLVVPFSHQTIKGATGIISSLQKFKFTFLCMKRLIWKIYITRMKQYAATTSTSLPINTSNTEHVHRNT